MTAVRFRIGPDCRAIDVRPYLRYADDDGITLPQGDEYPLTDGETTVELVPSTTEWCYESREIGLEGVTRYWSLPDQPATIDYEDLIDIIPSTFEPSVEAVAGWTAATIAAQSAASGVTGSVAAAAASAAAAAASVALFSVDNLPQAQVTGKVLMKTATAAAAQTAIGATTVGKAVLVAASATAARQAIGPNGSAYFLREVEKYYISRADLVGVPNAKTVIDTCTAAAIADGVRHVVLPAGTLPIQTQCRIPVTQPMTIEGQGEDTNIQLNVSGAAFSTALFVAGGNATAGFEGTKYALAGDLAAGAQVVTLPAQVASALVVGSTVGFECTTPYWGIGSGGQESKSSEFRNVFEVSGTTATLDSPLICAYTVAASATAYVMNLGAPLRFANMRFTSNDPTVNRQRILYCSRLRDVRVENVRLDNTGGGLYFHDVMRGSIDNVTVNKLTPVTSYLGYGVAVMGRSAEVTVNNLNGYGCRHLFTTLADERSDGSQWGGPRNVIVSNGVGHAAPDALGFAVWDTHPPGSHITFSNIQAFGGTGVGSVGIQIRSRDTKILNPTIRGMSGPGINVQESAQDCLILGGEVSNTGREGIFATAPGITIDGMRLKGNDGAGVIYSDAATDLQVKNNFITDSTNYGVQCGGAAGSGTGVVIKDNVIPKGVSRQAISILAAKVPATVANNVFRGYGAGLTGMYLPEAGLAVSGNITD